MTRLFTLFLAGLFLTATLASVGCDTGAATGATLPKGKVEPPKEGPKGDDLPKPPPIPPRPEEDKK